MDDFQDILEEKGIKYYLEKYKKGIIIGIGFIIIVLIIIILMIKDSEEDYQTNKEIEQLSSSTTEKKKEKQEKTVKVDIKGEVLNPSVYELDANSRIIDVIHKAGGLTQNADTTYINLSKKIKDEMVIILYSKEEIQDYKKDKEQVKYVYIENDCECPDEMNEACIEEKKTKKESNQEKTEEKDTLVSINEADVEELQTLSGIGKSKAESIIAYRKENGDFKTVEDIKNVSGIGDSVFEKIKDKITV